MPCESPCFDCPFRRDADVDEQYGWDFMEKHFGNEPEEYICPEQNDLCFGQITMLANNNMTVMLDPFSDLWDIVNNAKINREEYFWHFNEMRRYHEGWGEKYSLNQWRLMHGRKNIEQKPKAVVSGTQMTFDDWKG